MTQASSFDHLPDSAFVRKAQLIRDSKQPDSAAPLPFSAKTLHRKVRAGTFPAPCKLSKGVKAWKVGDVRSWMEKQSQGVNE